MSACEIYMTGEFRPPDDVRRQAYLEVVGTPDDFVPVFESLKKGRQNRALVGKIQHVIDSLHAGVLLGDQIKARQIPGYYVRKYSVDVLYRVELPMSRRLMYAIYSPGNAGRYAVILEVLDHNLYNKRFGYFKKK